MTGIEDLIFLAGILLLTAILSSTLSIRAGVPVLIIFLGIGMLFGEDGPFGLVFDDFALAHAVGTVALLLILFDGGLRTPFSSVGLAWRPAVALSTLGVALTAGITGLIAAWILDQPLVIGMLLGSIVGSTDAAAVFAILRGQGLHLRDRIAATLEVESGSNDPMAVLLTVGLVAVLTGGMELGWPVVAFFLEQAVIGAAGGLLVGALGSILVNRVRLTAAGLYPVLTVGIALLAYGLPAYLGGSGFLAVYLAGIVMGNARLVFKRGILQAHDGGAWMAQIAMFVTLGLLATPSRLLDVALEGTLVAAALIVVARPAAVFLTLVPFRFALREMAFLSWAGLKGAIPIILAIYPLLAGVPEGRLIFDVVFFAVLLSALVHGWTLPPVAQWLGVREEHPPAPPISLEITSLRDVDGDIVDYLVEPDSLAADRFVRELALPESAVIAMIVRDAEIIAPRGSTSIRPGDHVFVVLKPGVRSVVDRAFAPSPRPVAERAVELAFPLDATATVAEVEEFYGVHLDPNPDRRLGDLLSERLGDRLAEGAEIEAGEVRLAVRTLVDGVVTEVDIEVLRERDEQPPP
ncbi:MAG: potassium/proton antiporter [Gemmatimonadota bacterium]|nr:potassium/proton antiporter [Gemmatimonadota bacterium]